MDVMLDGHLYRGIPEAVVQQCAATATDYRSLITFEIQLPGEHGVAAAEVEPVATQQTKPNAGMGLLLDQNAKDKIFWDLIQVAMS